MLELLQRTLIETHLVIGDFVRRNLQAEIGRDPAEVLALADHSYNNSNQAARIASGSFLTLGMVIAPCSERSLGSIALGYANTLVHRAADVTMKEGRPLAIMLAAGSLSGSVSQYVEKLHQVPGVRVYVSPLGVPSESVDALLLDMLNGLGIQASTVTSGHDPVTAAWTDPNLR